MKKLLSILASVGLVATASTAVVSCTTTIKAKDVTVTPSKDGNNYTASWTDTIHFVQHTNYKWVDKSDHSKGMQLIPYKLAVVDDTRANEDNTSKPTDMFSWGGADGSNNATVTAITKDTDWVTKKNGYYVWPTPDGYSQPDGTKLNIDGIIHYDIIVKATITVTIPKESVKPGQSLKVALIREEPKNVEKYGEDQGRFMHVIEHVTIEIPTK